jgi:hypothetical protein
LIGRFMSADPFIQAPDNLQSYNRYAYVMNNPLAFTDPSGYISFKKLFRIAVVVGEAYFTGGAAAAWYEGAAAATTLGGGTAFTIAGGISGTAAIAGGAAGGAAAGFTGAALGGANLNQSLQAGVQGGFAGALSGGVGSSFGNSYSLTRVGAEAIAGGIGSRITGGKFSDGFRLAGAISGLTYLNYSMRQAMVDNASINPDNFSGESEGFFGDGKKLAGARREIDPSTGDYAVCVSLMGGCQGAPRIGTDDTRSSFFGRSYQPGSWMDRVNESFSGPHDWFRSATGSYNSQGNSIHFKGTRLAVDSVMNYALVLPAAPMAVSALIPASAYGALISTSAAESRQRSSR